MYKKLICSIICLSILVFSLSSCGVRDRLELDEDLHNVIEYVYEEDNITGISYQNCIYYIDKFNIIKVPNYNQYKNDIMLSWNGHRMGYLDVFCSYTNDFPIFIYETRLNNVFMHEKYDYMSDIFVIDGTDVEFLFSDIFNDFSKQYDIIFQDNICIKLHSKNYTRVAATLEIEYLQGIWYISFLGTETAWECSDSFAEKLRKACKTMGGSQS